MGSYLLEIFIFMLIASNPLNIRYQFGMKGRGYG